MSAQGVVRARYLHPTLVRVTKLSRSLAHPEWDLDETKLFISSHTMYLLIIKTRAGLTSGRNYSVHRCIISHLQAQILPDGSKMFPVSLSQVVRDSVKHFKVVFVLSLLFFAFRLMSPLAVCSPPSIPFHTATSFLKPAVTSNSTVPVLTFSLPACWLSLSILSVSVSRSNHFFRSSSFCKN
jgi:hypothetical protein